MGNTDIIRDTFWGPFLGWVLLTISGVVVTAASTTAVVQTGDLRPLPVLILGIGILAIASLAAYGWTIPETRRRWDRVRVPVNLLWVAVIVASASLASYLSWQGNEGPTTFSALALAVVSFVGLLVQSWLIPTWRDKTKLTGDLAWLAAAFLAAETAAAGGMEFVSGDGGEVYTYLILAAGLIGSIAVQHWMKRQDW